MGRGPIRPPSRAGNRAGKMNVNIIVTHSTPGAKAAKEATSTIPIVGHFG